MYSRASCVPHCSRGASLIGHSVNGAPWNCARWRPAGRDKPMVSVLDIVPGVVGSRGRVLALVMGLISVHNAPKSINKQDYLCQGLGRVGLTWAP